MLRCFIISDNSDIEQTIMGRIRQGDTEYKKTLQQYRSYLTHNMEVTEIIDRLYQQGILSDTQRLTIVSKQTMTAQAQALVEFLIHGEARDYAYFLEFLAKDHEHLYHLLVENKYDDKWEVYRDVLQDKRKILLENLDSEFLIDYLLAAGVINDSMREDFNSKRTVHDQNSYLLDLLLRRGSTGFTAFLQALDQTNQQHLSQVLRKTVEQVGHVQRMQVDPGPSGKMLEFIGFIGVHLFFFDQTL